MTTEADSIEPVVGGQIQPDDGRQQRRDDRDTLAAWRGRMRQGRASVVEWLDKHGDGPVGYARTLLDLRKSTDDRVRLGAVKIEAQLRDWFSDTDEKSPDQHLHVHVERPRAPESPEELDRLLRDVRARLPDRGGPVAPGDVEANGHE